MTSARCSILKRAGQYLAITTFTTGCAIGTAGIATAEFDVEYYDGCVANVGNPNILTAGPDTVAECCLASGGDPTPLGWPPELACKAPPVNEQATGQPAPPRSPEEIVGGPVRDFTVPDANVPDAPVIVLPAP